MGILQKQGARFYVIQLFLPFFLVHFFAL